MNKETLVEILKKMISIPSINPPGLEKAMGDYVLDILDHYEIFRETISLSPNRYSIIGKYPGKSREGIIFTGHMDVVPVSPKEEDRWKTNPFQPILHQGKIYGRGSADMKGGLAAGLCAMISLKEEGIIPPRDIFFVATVDEEDFMGGSKSLYQHHLLEDAKEVVVMEPTSLTCAHIGRGRTYGNIIFTGHTGHGSQGASPQNPILEASAFIEEMKRTKLSSHPKYGESFWQPVAINAGVEPCVVPDSCVLKIDARLHPFHNPKDIWTKVENMLTQGKWNGTIEIIDSREGFFLSQDSHLYQIAKDTAQSINLPFQPSVFMGTTDGSIFRKENRDVIIMGPGNLSIVHQENEHLHVEELYLAYDFYRTLMLSK
ncbi:MAG: M20 family metallopeptidase [Tissierellia bacterium]|nr:M20 family metallopeptidase [Tissierellia bacterium]